MAVALPSGSGRDTASGRNSGQMPPVQAFELFTTCIFLVYDLSHRLTWWSWGFIRSFW